MESAINKEKNVTRISIILFVVFIAVCNSGLAQEKVTTILLVRHAEKSTTPSDDPTLSPQGNTRTALLVDMLQNSGITAVYATQYARTKLTGEPIARKLRIPIQTMDAQASKKLANTILAEHAGRTVLVVGHSNTLAEIIEALGGGKIQEIDETDYNNLFVVTVTSKGTAKLLALKFFLPNSEQVCQ
jgi:broad specificity phosphatase PhoE